MTRHHHQFKVDLKGGIAQDTAQLGFRDDLGGHQIQKYDFQRTDMLCLRPGLLHNEDIFILEYSRCGKVIGYLNGHGSVLLSDFIRFPEPGKYLR